MVFCTLRMEYSSAIRYIGVHLPRRKGAPYSLPVDTETGVDDLLLQGGPALSVLSWALASRSEWIRQSTPVLAGPHFGPPRQRFDQRSFFLAFCPPGPKPQG